MLTFFRRIRKSLLDGGNTRRYLAYAIGERLLLMIGILLALQVNNWNEYPKDKGVQLRLLKELHATAGEDLARNKHHFEQNKDCLQSLEIVIKHLEEKIPFHDSLAYHFALAHSRWISQIKDNAYESIKEHGLDFIENDTTRNYMTHLYENRIQFLDNLET